MKLLEAQTAQLSGNHNEMRQVFEGMLNDPSTELLGLRGLYSDAKRNGDHARAAMLAKQACERNAGLSWASHALLTEAAIAGDWEAAQTLISRQRQNRVIDEKTANRWQAAILTGEAIAVEENDEPRAAALALKAHGLDPALAPAATVAARRLAQQGSLRKARRVIEKTWALSPHPDLAPLCVRKARRRPPRPAEARSPVAADSARRRRGAVVHARAAIDAQEWQEARSALESYAATNAAPRVCILMAEIEEGQSADKGKAREWLSRALRASAQDPAWVDDNGYVSTQWLPASPVTGEIGGFTWKRPAASTSGSAVLEQLAQQMEALPAPAVVAASTMATAAVEEEPEPETVAEVVDLIEAPPPQNAPSREAVSPPLVVEEVVDPGVASDIAEKPAANGNGFHQPDDPGIEQESKPAQKSWMDRLMGS